jgi:hypothetical protein
LVLTAFLCVLTTVGDARAAGCHVSDRPVLSSKLSPDVAMAIDLSMTAPAQAPAVLTHPTCPTEIPRLLNPAGGSPAVDGLRWVGLGTGGRSHSVAAHAMGFHAQPLTDPLDRPPRMNPSFGVIGLSV